MLLCYFDTLVKADEAKELMEFDKGMRLNKVKIESCYFNK